MILVFIGPTKALKTTPNGYYIILYSKFQILVSPLFAAMLRFVSERQNTKL